MKNLEFELLESENLTTVDDAAGNTKVKRDDDDTINRMEIAKTIIAGNGDRIPSDLEYQILSALEEK